MGKIPVCIWLVLMAGMLTGCAGSVATPTASMPPTSTPSPSVGDAAGQACEGKTVPGAASYNAGAESMHPIFIVGADGSPSSWNDSLPVTLRAKSTDTLEAVVCLGSQEPDPKTVKDCGAYTPKSGGSSIDLELGVYRLDARLVAASTGKAIVEKSLIGKPTGCPEVFNSTDPHLANSVLYGEDISSQDVLKELLPDLIPGSVPQQIGNAGMGGVTAVTTDGRLVASSSFGDKSIEVWDVKSNTRLSTLSGFKSDVQAIAFSPDGSRLASLGTTGEIIVWDVQTGKIINTLVKPAKNDMPFGGQVAFSPDGKTLTGTSLELVKGGLGGGIDTHVTYVGQWDVTSGKSLQKIYGPGGSDFLLSPDWTTLASVDQMNDYQQEFSFRELDMQKETHYMWNPGEPYNILKAFSQNGKQLLALAWQEKDNQLTQYQVLTLDALTGELISDTNPKDFPKDVLNSKPALYLADQNKLILCDLGVGSDCQSLSVFDLAQGSLLFEIKVPGDSAGSFDNFTSTPDGKYFVTDKLFLWNIDWLPELK